MENIRRNIILSANLDEDLLKDFKKWINRTNASLLKAWINLYLHILLLLRWNY